MYYVNHSNKNEKKTAGNSTNGAVTTGYPHTKNEVGCLPHTMYKNQPKMDQRPKCMR